VNAVAPTYVRTDLTAGILKDPELVARIEAMTPMRKFAEPRDIAAAIAFLVSPAAAMITGQCSRSTAASWHNSETSLAACPGSDRYETAV